MATEYDPINLERETAPINHEDPRYARMLAKLQGNILKPHGRDYAVHLFLEFVGSQDKVKSWIADFTSRFVTSALRQFDETREYKLNRIPGRLFGNFFLSAAGYQALGLGDRLKALDETSREKESAKTTFREGMEAAQQELNDPDPHSWEDAYVGRKIHAMILLADEDPVRLRDVQARLENNMAGIARVLAAEEGSALRDESNKPIEHFGYRDGISQPLFLRDDVKRVVDEAGVRDATELAYDPSAALKQLLVEDPLARSKEHGPDCFGSYLVFRKLEQNVRRFKETEEKLAEELGLEGEDEELAGAFVVGRFEDGVPVLLSGRQARLDPDSDGNPQWDPDRRKFVDANNFNYHQDPTGRRCPLAAHIRKVNPRGDNRRVFDVSREVESGPDRDAEERRRRIARRGITYGHRALGANGMPTLEDQPEGNVGLLFQCFQARICDQFAFIQKSWCNSPDFARSSKKANEQPSEHPPTGLDPLIGQFVAREGHPANTEDSINFNKGQQRWPNGWDKRGDPRSDTPFDFGDFITLKGGEFLFAPSIPFLRELGGPLPSVKHDQAEYQGKPAE